MVVNKKIAKKIGLINAIVISNLCSLEDKYGNGFYFTQEELAETCCVCLDTIKKSISYLKKNNFIIIEKRGLPCKNYYFFTTEFENFIINLIGEKNISNNALNIDKCINNNIIIRYKDQLKDKRWKKLANKIRKRDEYTCQMCGSHKKLQVHHKHYIAGKMAWEYNDSDLITLCKDCHKKIHNIK